MTKRGRPRVLTDEERVERKRARERDYYRRHRKEIALRRMRAYIKDPTSVLERGRRYHHAHRDEINARRRRNKTRVVSILMDDGTELSAPSIMAWDISEDERQASSIVETLYATLPPNAQALLHAFEASEYDIARSAKMVGVSVDEASDIMKLIRDIALQCVAEA